MEKGIPRVEIIIIEPRRTGPITGVSHYYTNKNLYMESSFVKN